MRQDADDYQSYLRIQEARKKFQRDLMAQELESSIKLKKDNE